MALAGKEAFKKGKDLPKPEPGRKDQTPEMVQLSQFEAQTEKLRNDFEMYFRGIEKKPPTDTWEALKKEIRKILQVKSNNTGYKFRRQSVSQKWTSFNTYWERIMKQIEDGTYARQVFLAKVHERARKPLTIPPLEAAKTGPKPAAKAPGDGVSAPLDNLYKSYIDARKTTGEATNIPKDKLAQVIAQQTAAIKEKFKCKNVEFKVSVEGGKTKLKAVPKF
ncbi:MAG: MXAN_5187 C-terminal domain-containing protein [Bdellovibrionota bacterium]